MTHILHLGHQPTDIQGIAGLISTDAGGFDPGLDVNAIRFVGSRSLAAPFALGFAAPSGDLWLGFRYVPPNSDSESITQSNANFLEFFDANNALVAQIRPLTSTNRYHAIAHGDTLEQGSSSYTAPNAQPQWVDMRLSVGAEITIEFHVDGVLRSTATAPNIAGKGKPRAVVFANTGLHGAGFGTRTWYYAHIAVLDGISTIGRRFLRRIPDAIASFDQMQGGVAALADGDIATRVASDAPGQRMSFTLMGPAGPAALSTIAGVHLKQVAQAGSEGPDAIAGFLRMGGVNHDADPVSVPSIAPQPVWSSWPVNPVDGSPWDTASLPTEVGILSA